MIKSLLIPFDGSDSADAALTIGCSMAGITGSTVHALFVEDERRFMQYDLSAYTISALGAQPIVPFPLPPEKAVELEMELNREYDELNEIFREKLDEAQVQGELKRMRGLPSECILKEAQMVDFVVTGKHGKHQGVEYIAEGLTTHALLQNTTRPVLVVPKDPRGEAVMVIAYDGSAAAERTLRCAAELSILTEMKTIHLVTVTSKPESGGELLTAPVAYLAPYHCTVVSKVLHGNPHDLILQYSQEVGASILCLGAFGKRTLASMIFGSTTASIVRDAHTALLLMA